MGTQKDMESANKGGTSCDWSFGNHYHETDKDFLAEMGIHVSFETIQKASLFRTAHILRKVLS